VSQLCCASTSSVNLALLTEAAAKTVATTGSFGSLSDPAPTGSAFPFGSPAKTGAFGAPSKTSGSLFGLSSTIGSSAFGAFAK
jgi:hypothetical protein